MLNLNEENHSYVDENGEIYTSVTKVIGAFSQYFDRERISYYVSEKKGVEQEEILAEWDAKQQEASDFGELIHLQIEQFLTGQIGENCPTNLQNNLYSIYRNYDHIDSEATLHSEENKIAGRADAVLYNSRHPKCIVDIHDFKTNMSKGIQFKDPHKKYMHTPLKHLMDCNFNHYALQLSSYAYLLQQDELIRTGTERKIGELAIMFINSDLTIQKWPVPFMKYEVERMFEQYQKIRGINLNW